MVRGHLLWATEGRVEPVPPGSVFFTLPGREHGSAEEFEPGHEWCYIILAPPANSRRILPDALDLARHEARRIESALRRSPRHAFPATSAMRWLLPSLVDELARPGLHHREHAANLARAVVVELARSIARPADPEPRPTLRGPAESVRQLADRIIRAPEADWTLSPMAASCGLARSRFSEHFLQHTGDTPLRFVNRMRVRKACLLLRTTAWPVTRVAMDCGFETSQYFAAVFKKYTGGITAGEYRRRRGTTSRTSDGAT